MKAFALRQIASDVAFEVFVRSPLEGRIWVTKIGGDRHGVGEFVMKHELAAIVCGYRGDRVGRQEGKRSVLPTPGCLRGDCGSLRSTHKPRLAFHTGVYPTRTLAAEVAF